MKWSDAARQVYALPPGQNLQVNKGDLTHPRDLEPCFRASLGLSAPGVKAHWRCLDTATGRCIHVLETDDLFLVHWDLVDPSVSFLGHLYADAPQVAVTGGVLLGAGLGAALSGKDGALWGALAGVVLSLAARAGVQLYHNHKEAQP